MEVHVTASLEANCLHGEIIFPDSLRRTTVFTGYPGRWAAEGVMSYIGRLLEAIDGDAEWY